MHPNSCLVTFVQNSPRIGCPSAIAEATSRDAGHDPDLRDVEQHVHDRRHQVLRGVAAPSAAAPALLVDWPMTWPIFSPPPASSSGVRLP